MLNEIWNGKLKSSTTGEKTFKDAEGNKEKIVMKKIKIITDSIDEDTFIKTFPEVNTHITAIIPSHMKKGSFEVPSLSDLCLKFRTIDENDYENEMEFLVVKDCEITDLTVVNKNNIFEYHFTLEFPVESNPSNKYIDGLTGKLAEFVLFQQEEF